MEHWEELKPGGFRFVWDDALFRPGTDSFLLSALPRLKPGLRVCDLGSGTGLLGLLLLQREAALDVTGVEIQPRAVELAEVCAAANGLDGEAVSIIPDRPDSLTAPPAADGKQPPVVQRPGRLRTVRGDLRNVRNLLPAGGFDLVVSNPPYYETGHGRASPDAARNLSRSGCSLSDVVRAAAYLLPTGGAFCLCQKPERLTDVLYLLREAACEPKHLRAVCPRPGAAPSLFLLEGRRGGRPGLSVEPPLYLQTAEGVPTEELDRIYFRRV